MLPSILFAYLMTKFLLGTDVTIFTIFSPKIVENIGISVQSTSSLCKIRIITLVFKKNANFSPKNVIIGNIDP
jgi:hypothetical protein